MNDNAAAFCYFVIRVGLIGVVAACAMADEVDLSHFDDGLTLKLCDSLNNCVDPGGLAFLGGDTDEERKSLSVWVFPVDAVTVDDWEKMKPFVDLLKDPGRQEIRCDQIGTNLFACGGKGFELPEEATP